MKKLSFLLLFVFISLLSFGQDFNRILSDTNIVKQNFWKKERLSYYLNADSSAVENYLGYFQRGYNKMQNELFDEAILDFKKSVNEDRVYTENIPSLNKDRHKNDALFYIATCYFFLDEKDSSLFYYHKTIESDPYYTNAYLQIATIHHNDKNMDAMIDIMEYAVEKNPSSAELHYNLGISYLANEQKQKAKKTQKYLIDQFPQYERSYVLLAYLYFFEGKNKMALNTISRSIEINPNFPLSYYLRGLLYILLKEESKAYADLSKYLEYDSTQYQLIYEVAKLDFIYGNDSVGLARLYKNIRMELADTNSYYNTNPIKHELLSLLRIANSDSLDNSEKDYIKAYYQESFGGDMSGAKKVLEAYEKSFPESDFAKRFIINKYCLNYRASEFEYDTDEIIDLLNILLRKYPTNVFLWSLKGDVLENDNRYDQAIIAYKRGVSLKSEYDYPLLAIAGIYYELEKYDSAIECYDRLIKQNPTDLSYHYQRAEVYKLIPKLKRKALDDYLYILETEPIKSNDQDFLLEMVELYLDLAIYDTAIMYLDNIDANYPDQAGIIESRGTAYFNLGNFEAAIMDYSKAIEIHEKGLYQSPNRGQIYFKRGNTYFYKARFEDALDDYNAALKIYPNDPTVEGAIGDCYRNLDEYDKALKYYDLAIAGAPQNKWYYFKKAVCLSDARHYKSSIKSFSEALLIDTTLTEAYAYIGWNYYNLGKYNQSVHFSKKALSIDPSAYYASFTIGLAIMRLGYYDKAFEIFDQTKAITAKDEDFKYDRYIQELKTMLLNENHQAMAKKTLTEVFEIEL